MNKKEQLKKYKSYRHIKNKSESHLLLKNKLIDKNKEEENNKINVNNNTNTNNKSNCSFNKSINNVFTFSKIDGTNDKNLINSNCSKRSNSCNTNNRNKLNNLVIQEEKDILSLKSIDINNNNNNKCINYFNVNFNENNLRLKYNEDNINMNNTNNIFDTDYSSSSLMLNTSNNISQRPYTSLVYSIRRKKEKEKEDENKISKKLKKHRTNSCYRFKFNTERFNNIFLNNKENNEKKESRIKTIKIKLKDHYNYNTYNTARTSINNAINISDYSRDEKNISFLMNNTVSQEIINYSLNDIQEKNSENKNSKSNEKEKEQEKEKENDKTKNNTNDKTDISLGSLKSFKSSNSNEKEKEEEKEKEIKQNENFEGMDIYSYINTSDMNNNKENITNIRSQISQVIKQNEEIINKTNDNDICDENESDTNIIFTSRIREEMTEPNSNNKDNKEKKEVNEIKEIKDENENEDTSNIMNTSNINCYPNHLRFSSDLNDLIHSLEKPNKYETNKFSIPFSTFYKSGINFNFLDLNFESIINDKNLMKNVISKIDNNEIFIYDSFICDLLLTKIKERLKCLNYSLLEEKGNITKNKILGKIYELSNNKFVKNFLICEMIAIVSKKELEKIMVNAIEVYNKKKEINKEEKNVNYDEYIFDFFNEYLSKNKNLYENILPKKIKELFHIKEDEGIISNIIKNEINGNNVFNSMQFHNKIYVYNINIEKEIVPDFNSLKPLDNEQFKYHISPYISEKWKFKASSNNDSNNNANNIIKDNFRFDLIGININYETKIYKRYKISEKFDEFQKFNLFFIILSNIVQNEINLALKNCEYFLEKYKASISFLHSLIYLCISFIYNTLSNFDLAEKYYEKCIFYLKWLFHSENNYLFFEVEYKHLLILLNNEENIILKNIENIVKTFDKCGKMWKKYYKDEEIGRAHV